MGMRFKMGPAYINLSWTCPIYTPVVPVSLLIGLNDKEYLVTLFRKAIRDGAG